MPAIDERAVLARAAEENALTILKHAARAYVEVTEHGAGSEPAAGAHAAAMLRIAAKDWVRAWRMAGGER
jgi:hypothetical protein